jgi:hypothetical protein
MRAAAMTEKSSPNADERIKLSADRLADTPRKPHKSPKPKGKDDEDDEAVAPDGREPDPNNPQSGVGRDPE